MGLQKTFKALIPAPVLVPTKNVGFVRHEFQLDQARFVLPYSLNQMLYVLAFVSVCMILFSCVKKRKFSSTFYKLRV